MIIKLVKSNIRNDFGQIISYFLILILSVWMLHTGLLILFGYSRLYAEKQVELNGADVVIRTLSDSEQEMAQLLSADPSIRDYERYEILSKEVTFQRDGYDADTKNGNAEKELAMLFEPYGEWGEIEKPGFVEQSTEEYDNPIYLSLYEKTNLGVELGDTFHCQISGKDYSFTVAGFFEQIITGGIMETAYVSAEQYNAWREQMIKDMGYGIPYLYCVRLAEGQNDVVAGGELMTALGSRGITGYVITHSMTVSQYSYMQNIIAAILSAFALVITAVSLIIIYFKISNSIEQNITNIGALKALGYTSAQIRLSMVLEFTLTAAVACVLGTGISYGTLSFLEPRMRYFAYMVWKYRFDPAALLITMVLIVGAAMLVSFFGTKSIVALDPVQALRFGLCAHSFRKNHFPMETTDGPLTWLLALKAAAQNRKQNIMLVGLMLAVGFVGTFSVFLGYNTIYKKMNLFHLVNGITPDVEVTIRNPDAFYDIAELSGVKSVFWEDIQEMTVEDYSVYCTITDDFGNIAQLPIYEGRAPKYDNEIAVGGVLAQNLGVSVGDEVTVSGNGKSVSYLITGLQQGATNMGMEIYMTEEGAKHLLFEVSREVFCMEVQEPKLENSLRLVEELENMYGTRLLSYSNSVESLENGEDITITVCVLVISLLLIVSVLVIVLSMNLLVKTVIIRKQREYGIEKAIGFSSGQLRLQLALSMMPQTACGAVCGALLGYLFSNRLLSALLNSVGVMKANMEVGLWMGLLSAVCVVGAVFLLVWVISSRIRRISAYSLITD